MPTSEPAAAPSATEPSAPATTAPPAALPTLEPAAPNASSDAPSDTPSDAPSDAPSDEAAAPTTTDATPDATTDAPAHVAAPPSQPEPTRSALGPRTFVDDFPRETDEPEPRRYDGFSVRLSAALGYANAMRDLDAAPTEVTGFDASVMLDVGSTLSENLIAYGRVGGFALNHASDGDSPNAGSAYFALLGAGARYHFLPFDWYASGTLALVVMSVTNDVGSAENADPGFGLQLETGKQWPAGAGHDQTTIGLGLRASYVRCGSTGTADEPWIGKALSLVFSTSYN